MSTIPFRQAPGDIAPAPENPQIENDPVPHYTYDASLLFHRMELHQVDRVHLADHDPLLFRELQARCALCPSKEQCVLDNLNNAMSEEARAYCANASTLTAFGKQAQKIALPRTPGEARHGPQQYYYIGSKGGVVPQWWAESASHIP